MRKSLQRKNKEKERETKSETEEVAPTLRMFIHPLWSFHVLGLLPLWTGKRKWRHKNRVSFQFYDWCGEHFGNKPKRMKSAHDWNPSILPSQTGQHLSSGWMVREQVNTGQMTGSQITVRFCREKYRKMTRSTFRLWHRMTYNIQSVHAHADKFISRLLFKCFNVLVPKHASLLIKELF